VVAKHDLCEEVIGTLRFATPYFWVCWEKGGCLGLVVGCDLELPTLKKGDRGGVALNYPDCRVRGNNNIVFGTSLVK